jgi:hypothetical protein
MEQEQGGFQKLGKIGELMHMFRDRCESRYQPGTWLSLDEMMVLFTEQLVVKGGLDMSTERERERERERSLLDKLKGVPICQRYRRWPSDVCAALFFCVCAFVSMAYNIQPFLPRSSPITPS